MMKIDDINSYARLEYLLLKLNNPSFDEMDDDDKAYIIYEIRHLMMLERRKRNTQEQYAPGYFVED